MAHEGITGRRTSHLKASFTIWLVPKRGDIAAQRAAEELWATRVQAARTKYKHAESQLRQIIAGQQRWPLPEPHGTAVLQTARLQEVAARNEYLQSLKVFSELLVAGELPD
jgi:hypothetical protein